MYLALLYRKNKSPKTLCTGDYAACIQALRLAADNPDNQDAQVELKWQPPAGQVGDTLKWLSPEDLNE
jgi:hypothetical protein